MEEILQPRRFGDEFAFEHFTVRQRVRDPSPAHRARVDFCVGENVNVLGEDDGIAFDDPAEDLDGVVGVVYRPGNEGKLSTEGRGYVPMGPHGSNVPEAPTMIADTHTVRAMGEALNGD